MKTSSYFGHITELVDLIQKSSSPADRIVAQYFLQRRYLGARDRRFIAERTYSLFRYAYRTERMIGEALNRLHITVPAVYPRLWMIAAHAVDIGNSSPVKIVDDMGGLWNTVEPRIEPIGFLQTVVSMNDFGFCGNDPVERCSVRTSFPRWMVESWATMFGLEKTEQLCEALNLQAPLTLRVNTLATDVAACMERLRGEGIESTRTGMSPFGLVIPKRMNFPAHESFREGFYEIQDEGSQLVSLLADPRPGQTVIDACAGGGGKSLHCAALMQNKGTIHAFDTGKQRLEQLTRRAERAGATIISPNLIGEEGDPGHEFDGKADVVLIDVPCSGTGTIRRNPVLKWRIGPDEIRRYAARQKDLLQRYSRWTAPGGRLVYATCSLLRAENDDVVEDFVKKNSDFVVQNPEEILSRWGIHGLAEGNVIRLNPSVHGTDGFFIAVMKRCS